MTSSGSVVPGRGASAGKNSPGAPKLVRFFSVEGQRRRLEFANLPAIRAMTPQEESEFLAKREEQQQAELAQQKEAEKAAKDRIARERAGRQRLAARSNGAVDNAPGVSATGSSRRGRPAPEVDAAVEHGHRTVGRRSGGSRASGDSATQPATSAPAAAETMTGGVIGHSTGTTGGETAGRGKTPTATVGPRRGVIGGSPPREEEGGAERATGRKG